MKRAMVLAILAAMTGSASFAADAPANTQLKSPTWFYAHLGPRGVQKCRAFQKIANHVARLQKGDHGQLPKEWTSEIEYKLSQVRAMQPRSVTASECGVPL